MEEYVEKVRDIAKLTSKNESSMLSDIKRGSQTEVDFINGFIITVNFFFCIIFYSIFTIFAFGCVNISGKE